MPALRRERKGKRQRFYARTGLKTTLLPGRLMQSFLASRTNPHYPNWIHLALSSFADECCGMLARLFAYVGTLALLAIVGVHLWDQLPDSAAAGPPAKSGWSTASRWLPAFAVSQPDSLEKTKIYDILRHPEGGRKDVFRWGFESEPLAELEIYRPGAESSQPAPDTADLAARMDPDGRRELEAAGILDSKFGQVTLFRLAGRADAGRSCLGFIKRLDEPNLQISGWSCQGEALPAQRAAIACVLSRLVLLQAGNDPKLAELFARAELRRGGSCAAAASTLSADWVTGAENPPLRGAI